MINQMNRTFFVLLMWSSFIIAQTNLYAQANQQAETIWSNQSLDIKSIGFFAAPAYGITQIGESTASLFQARGGLSWKDQLSLGAYFNVSLNQIEPPNETISDLYLDYWTVGGFIEYTWRSDKKFHITFPVYLGYGELQMDNENGDAGFGEANFFQVEPNALLEINLHKYIRLNFGGGYRWLGPVNYRGLSESDVSGLTAYIGMKLGLFR